ncbi:MAG: hypothetical protein F2934_01650 [Actinobacteria bacterium]|uniref:Unannotated protein n=1 Tax=freshwater metagenome TaxID=449393 RepID=A0A6J7TM82_9ZZZZ|nr:hypothetical protein [Actinomycetota bacterium]MSY12623.1 hypothetical protein [Actinomycetota bacterium]MSZ03713.1 hypothetical protein [Actinomycetota bacterium]MTB05815.1 hypothetical protein [Actinomycetota bacterium]
MSIRVCPLCSAEYLDFKESCNHCGVALVEPGEDIDIRLLDEDEQVVYDLSAWPIDAQTETAIAFAESGLPHLWDGTDLIIPEVHEESADRMLERIEDQFDLVEEEEREMLAEEDAESADPESVGDTSGGDTEFSLDGWDSSRRMELVERLVEIGIAHRWEGELLVVPTDRDEDVEAILDEMDGVEPRSESSHHIDPADIASVLFLTAERMRKGKVDATKYAELLEALDAAEPAQPPFGVDPNLWMQMLELGEDLADAVAEDTDEIEEVASNLYALLRPLI